MTIHYHGTPITPASIFPLMGRRHFCVSIAYPVDVERAHRLGQSVMLDNGAFSFWKQGKATDWKRYYEWCEKWLEFPTTWAVIPDVIEGGAEEQDRLLAQWPFGARGVPVWHFDEPIDRLIKLCETWPKVCLGSTDRFPVLSEQWERRMDFAFNELSKRHRFIPWLHMLRGLNCCGRRWPFGSADSADVGRNYSQRPGRDIRGMADRWDEAQCLAPWKPVVQKEFFK